MAEVVVKDLVKRFGSETLAVDNVSFTVGEGEFVTLLGPSGCGKTTTLRCIAGLETPDEGDILIANEVFTSSRNGVCLPPEKRRLGMVFQSYAIWPHMSVSENVAYGIQAQGASRAEVNEKSLMRSNSSAWVVWVRETPQNYPAVNNSGSPSPAHWPTTPCSPFR